MGLGPLYHRGLSDAGSWKLEVGESHHSVAWWCSWVGKAPVGATELCKDTWGGPTICGDRVPESRSSLKVI